MNNEKICPVYSASDNTARKCIKEECGGGGAINAMLVL